MENCYYYYDHCNPHHRVSPTQAPITIMVCLSPHKCLISFCKIIQLSHREKGVFIAPLPFTPGPGFKERTRVCQLCPSHPGKARAMCICELARIKGTGCVETGITLLTARAEKHRKAYVCTGYPDLHSEGYPAP